MTIIVHPKSIAMPDGHFTSGKQDLITGMHANCGPNSPSPIGLGT